MAIDWKTRVSSSSGDTSTTTWQTQRVYHIKKDGHNLLEVCYGLNSDGTPRIVWEEFIGTYSIGTLPTGIASLSCSRVSKDPAISSGTLSNNDYLYNKDTLTFSATASSYWTASMTHPTVTLEGMEPDSALVREHTVYGVTESGLKASRNMRTITVTKNTGVASISVTYTNSSGTRTTSSYTASASISAWQGATVTWTATASSGYTMSTSSGTVAIGTSGATISPTAKVSYSKGWYSYPEFTSTLSASWTSSQWSSTTYSNAVSLKTFAYLRVHTSGVRVSGTMTMGTKTVSFSNVSLTLNSYTNVTTLEYSSRYTYALQLQLSGNTLGARAQCTSTAKYKRAFSITITSIQVYTYPAEAKLSAPTNVSIGDYAISVTNGNEVSAYCVYQGYALFGSSYEYRDTGAWGMGSTPLIVTSGNSNQIGSVALLGSDEDVSINTLEAFKIAFVADAYLDVGEYVSLDF